jgi:hypothetical protein
MLKGLNKKGRPKPDDLFWIVFLELLFDNNSFRNRAFFSFNLE